MGNDTNTGLRIIELRAENVRRLKAVHITPDPDGNLVIIGGDNGMGKTSVLDAIALALGGAAASKLTQTTRPVRDGAEGASVKVELGSPDGKGPRFVVERKWTADGGKNGKLIVSSPEGARYQQPQEMLDGFLGLLSFDPLDFARQAPKAQVTTLLQLVDIGIDLDALAERRQVVYSTRTDANRRVHEAEVHLTKVPEPEEGIPDEEVVVSALVEELRKVDGDIAETERTWAARTAAKLAVERADARVTELETALLAAKQARNEAAAEERSAARAAEKRPPIDDAEAARVSLQAQVAKAEETNRKVRAAADRAKLVDQLVLLRATASDLTDELAEIDRSKTDALAATKMPVDGLSFDDDGVTFNGLPFAQASAAEQLRVSLAMAMTMNPTIRVIRITDGSLLDAKSLAIIDEMAGASGHQIFLERVGDADKGAIIIEDGSVRDDPA